MSIAAQNAVWTHSKAPSTARFVLLCIADHINEDGLAWPSIDTVAQRCALSVRQVQRCIKLLTNAPLNELIPDRGTGRGKTTVYRLGLPLTYPERVTSATKGDILSPFTEPERVTSATKGDILSPFTEPERVTFTTERVTSCHPEPLESDLDLIDLISPLTPQPVSPPAHPPAPVPVAEPPLLEINSAFAMAMVTTPDSDRAERHPAFAETCRLFENSFARFLTPDLTDAIDSWLKQYLADWVTEAIADAAKRHIAHPKPYIAKMLENWKVAGKREKLASANATPTLLSRSMNQTQRRRTPAGGPPHATPAPVPTTHTREQLDFIAAVQAKNRAWREANLEPAAR